MKKFTTCLVFLILMTGCAQSTKNVSVDLSNASTDAGYINSKLENIGTLYLLDTNNSTLTELAEIELTRNVETSLNTTYEAKNINNIGANGNVTLNDTELAAVKSSIKKSTYINLKNAKRKKFINNVSDLANYIRREISSDEYFVTSWSLEEATVPNSHLRYVLIYSMITADSAEFNVTKGANLNTSVGKGKHKVVLNIDVNDKSLQKFTGSNSPVLIKYNIYKASIRPNNDGIRTYHFASETRLQEKLNEALRK